MCRHVSHATRMPQDLILWEYVRLEFLVCSVKLPLLSCGEIPDGMRLPRSCKNIGMPATFIASQQGDGANATEDEASKQKYLVKFFENGEYSVEGPWRVQLRRDHAQWYNGVRYRDMYLYSYFTFVRSHITSQRYKPIRVHLEKLDAGYPESNEDSLWRQYLKRADKDNV